jgi:predicted nucleic acid-binding protein
MSSVMFDSSIYIAALRVGHDAALQLRRLAKGESIWLSSVVLEELYAGANAKNWHIVERFERDFERTGRVLAPNLKDWAQAGKVLALLAAKYDFEQIGRGRLTNDVLIAMSAARTGVTVITANARDFEKLAEFRQFLWRIENTINVNSRPTDV